LATGILLEYSLPPRSGSSQIWDLSRHQWGYVHFISSVTFIALMAAHLLTHIKYIKSVFLGKAQREYKYRIAIGIVGLIALVALAVTLLTAPVEKNNKIKGWEQNSKY
jgi:predicted Co/Zn/Cd cation transporter (cation efflux family)